MKKNNIIHNYFAKNLKFLRKQNNLSQEFLGKLIDVDYSTIGKYETGQRSPSAEKGILLSRHFNKTYDDMITKDFEKEFIDNQKNGDDNN